MIAVLVVIVVIVKVLEQFGLLEASYDGKHKAFIMLTFASRRISQYRYFVRSGSFVVERARERERDLKGFTVAFS